MLVPLPNWLRQVIGMFWRLASAPTIDSPMPRDAVPLLSGG